MKPSFIWSVHQTYFWHDCSWEILRHDGPGKKWGGPLTVSVESADMFVPFIWTHLGLFFLTAFKISWIAKILFKEPLLKKYLLYSLPELKPFTRYSVQEDCFYLQVNQLYRHSYIAVYIYSTELCVHTKVSIVAICIQMILDLLHLFYFYLLFCKSFY